MLGIDALSEKLRRGIAYASEFALMYEGNPSVAGLIPMLFGFDVFSLRLKPSRVFRLSVGDMFCTSSTVPPHSTTLPLVPDPLCPNTLLCVTTELLRCSSKKILFEFVR